MKVRIDCYSVVRRIFRLNIQILGTQKCKNTKKAIRFFKERNISAHFRDITVKGLSKGELTKIIQQISIEDIIDTSSAEYQKKGYQYMDFDIAEEIMENPLLIKTPIIRNGIKVAVGNNPDQWNKWIKEEK